MRKLLVILIALFHVLEAFHGSASTTRCRGRGCEQRVDSLGVKVTVPTPTTKRLFTNVADCRQRAYLLQSPLNLSASPNGSAPSKDQRSDKNSNSNNGRRRLPNPLKSIKLGIIRLINARARLSTRFQALPRRAKRIVLAYVLLVTLAFGSLARSVVHNTASPPPVEISYSSFLDLVDGQAVDSNYNAPMMDRVRIGSDRINYRLYNEPSQSVENLAITPQKDRPATTLSLELPSLSSRRAQRLAQKQSQRPYLSAYTRQIPATVPPQLLDQLRTRDIAFAALPAPRPSTLALAVRTFMTVGYFVILFRFYKAVSGANGGGKDDTPGKLAQTTDLPMASFDEIQGIDNAKLEVMELVDTLRNPEKYAILGARAPTGLLLVGPPGTGEILAFYCYAVR